MRKIAIYAYKNFYKIFHLILHSPFSLHGILLQYTHTNGQCCQSYDKSNGMKNECTHNSN